MLMPEDHAKDEVAHTALTRAGSGHALPSTMATGYRYVEMGYTACFEPAMLPANARQAHMEMGDTPILDNGAYVMLGNDDFPAARHGRGSATSSSSTTTWRWTIHATQAIGVKVVNPGGISAFKFNQRKLDVDEQHVHWQVTPREIVQTLARALRELGVPHPLHIHGSNLGVPGNVESTLATIDALEGLPLHLTHIQFHSYGTEGDEVLVGARAARRGGEASTRTSRIDVGQIMFGQTVHGLGRHHAPVQRLRTPTRKWIVMDIECDAGCGVVPFRYRDKSYVNALQWAIGLEIFLLCEDPWRMFLTTDHPNGAPFNSYPHLIRLLMDRGFRRETMQRVHPDALKYSRCRCSSASTRCTRSPS